MSIAVVLPARLGSTRLPEKLLLAETGKTVLEHTLTQAEEARRKSNGLIRTLMVVCDHERLAEAAGRAGARVFRSRREHPSGTDRIAEALEEIAEPLIINLQADEPEIAPEAILQVGRLLHQAESAISMATLAAPILSEEEFRKPNVVKVVLDAAGRALYFSRAPIPHPRDPHDPACHWGSSAQTRIKERVWGLHHLGLYAYRRSFLVQWSHWPPSRLERIERLEQLRVLEAGHQILVGLTASHPPGIDTLEDYRAFVNRWRTKKNHG